MVLTKVTRFRHLALRHRLSYGFAIFGSLAILIKKLTFDFRPMTLRRQVSLGLLFSEWTYYRAKDLKVQYRIPLL